MTDESLRRAYARLLWAYPGWYRRERGPEMITTLLDAAHGRRRPTWPEAADLILRGLRCRFRPPRGAVARCFVVANAAVALAYAAALALQLTAYPGPPAEAAATAAARTATGRVPHDIPGPVHSGGYPAFWDGRDDVVSHDGPADLGGAHVAVYDNAVAEQAPARLVLARERLAAAGWRVEPVSAVIRGQYTFTAGNGTLTVRATEHTTDEPGFVPYDPASARPGDTLPTMEFVVSKVFPARVAAGVLPAGLAGLLAAWTVTTWVLHRFRRHRRAARSAIGVAGACGLAGVAVLSYGYLMLGVLAAVDGEPARHLLLAPVDVLRLAPGRAAALLALAGYGAALAVCALPARGGPRRPAAATTR